MSAVRSVRVLVKAVNKFCRRNESDCKGRGIRRILFVLLSFDYLVCLLRRGSGSVLE